DQHCLDGLALELIPDRVIDLIEAIETEELVERKQRFDIQINQLWNEDVGHRVALDEALDALPLTDDAAPGQFQATLGDRRNGNEAERAADREGAERSGDQVRYAGRIDDVTHAARHDRTDGPREVLLLVRVDAVCRAERLGQV